MFTKQAPVFRQQLEQAGFSTEQASAVVSMIGQCMASLEHRGPVFVHWPSQFFADAKDGWRWNCSTCSTSRRSYVEQSSSFSQGCNVVVVSRWRSQRRRRN